MKSSILKITLLAALSGVTSLATTIGKSNAQQLRTGITTHQSGFRSTVCIQNKPCRSIEMNIQLPQTTAIQKEEETTQTMSKAKYSLFDFLPEFIIDFREL